MTTNNKPKLGDIARDRITGFEGVIVVHARWLIQCDRYTLQSKELKDGKILSASFDEPSVDVIGASGIEVLPPNRPKEPLELGDTVKHIVNGLVGIVYAIEHHRGGCSRVIVMPKGLGTDGKPLDLQSFDEMDTVALERVRPRTPEETPKGGGPRAEPVL